MNVPNIGRIIARSFGTAAATFAVMIFGSFVGQGVKALSKGGQAAALPSGTPDEHLIGQDVVVEAHTEGGNEYSAYFGVVMSLHRGYFGGDEMAYIIKRKGDNNKAYVRHKHVLKGDPS